MGNVLCKEPNTSASPSRGNTFSNLSSVICPNGLSKAKTHPMRKTYFTRSAVDASKKTTSATGWQSVGLHVPASTTAPNVIDTPPVAPPRKKRGSTLDGRYRSDDSLQVKNGFHDVFGRESRRHSCDIARPASVPPPRPEVPALPARQTSCFEIDASNDAFSDFSKVPTTAELERAPLSISQIPRVGNRKSDKFFGERLADSLSATTGEAKGETKPREKRTEPTTTTTTTKVDDVDRIEKFIDKDTEQEKAPPVVVERRKHAGESRKSPVGPSEEPAKEAGQDGPDGPKQEAAKAGEEDLMKYIDRTVSGDNQIGRRAEFLMAMLEDYNDSVRYDGMQPVEEPLIVPKRRKSRHICDDHDLLHAKLHEHERDASDGATLMPPPGNNVIRTEASIEQAPRKPSRDFSKYKPIEPEREQYGSEDEPEAPVARPARIKQKQREQLPSPPAPPKFAKSLSESQFDRQQATDVPSSSLKPTDGADGDGDLSPKAHTPRMLKRIISMPTTENLGKEPASTPPRPALTKSSSSGSFAAVDLQRTRISVERFTPEDYAHHTGTDELVKPKSKLTTRKISWKSTEPPIVRTPTPTQEHPSNPSFTIGGTAVVTSESSTLLPPEVPRRKRSDTSTEMESIGEREREADPTGDNAKQVSQAKLYQQLHNSPEDNSLRKFCLGSFIESSQVLQHHDVVNVLDRVYRASDNHENIIEQFQVFLEDQLNAELDEPNPVNPNVAKLLEKLARADNLPAAPAAKVGADERLENINIDLVGSSLSGSSSPSQGKSSDVDDCFDPEFEKIEKSEIVGELPKIEQHTPKHVGNSGRRRESIEYLSDWFGGGDSDGSTTMLAAAGEDKGASEGRPTPLEGGVARKGGLHHAGAGARRESIEDVGRWFSNHNILRPTFGEEFEEPSRRMRRGSDGFLGYDLQRQYPFGQGRERSESQSGEMFEDIIKLQEQHKDSSAEGAPSQARINLPQRKVLEHRNSSDALLLRVLHKPLLNSLNSSKQGSVEKLNTMPESTTETTSTTSTATTTTTTSGEENKPLLTPDAPVAGNVEQGSKLTANPKEQLAADSSVALLNDAKGEPHGHQAGQPNEHSTLLKFLSKENLIE